MKKTISTMLIVDLMLVTLLTGATMIVASAETQESISSEQQSAETLVIQAPDRVKSGEYLRVVVTANGKPVGGSLVFLLRDCCGTDENGVAEFEAPRVRQPMTVRIIAVHPYFILGSVEILILPLSAPTSDSIG